MHFSYDALCRYLIYIPSQGHVDNRNYEDTISSAMRKNLSWQKEMKVQKVHYQTLASRKLKNKIGKWNQVLFRKQRGVQIML